MALKPPVLASTAFISCCLSCPIASFSKPLKIAVIAVLSDLAFCRCLSRLRLNLVGGCGTSIYLPEDSLFNFGDLAAAVGSRLRNVDLPS